MARYRYSKLGRTEIQLPMQRGPIIIVEDVRACRPYASITLIGKSLERDECLRSATFTNAFGPVSSAPSQVQV